MFEVDIYKCRSSNIVINKIHSENYGTLILAVKSLTNYNEKFPNLYNKGKT